ncbi:MAG: hypothetical protein P8N02_12155 [Actinomycetota bacterium]|nr:hypothetical protein [Actinomycetota bacterium]
MAHSRPASLQRLLRSVEQLSGRQDVSLVVAVDPGASDQTEVLRVARDVDWPAARFALDVADEPLGLVGNFERCGNMTGERGDIVLLEDDLEVASTALDWLRCALDQYRNDPLVTGLSLNALWFNGFTGRRFEPLPDGSDVFFLRLPWYQGMVFTREWWTSCMSQPVDPVVIHSSFDSFDADEWYPDMVRCVAASGRFFAYPRVSQAINHGEPGTHFARSTGWFQTPLERAWREPRLVPCSDSEARYDHYMEYDREVLAKLVEGVPADVLIDLTAQRVLPPTGPVLTVRPTTSADRRWGDQLRPLEANIVHDRAGRGIALTDAGQVDRGRRARWSTERRLDLHDRHGGGVSLRRELLGRVATRLQRGSV